MRQVKYTYTFIHLLRDTVSMLTLLFSILSIPSYAVPPRNNPKVEDHFAELEEEVVLRFFDAITGRPLSNAKVIFEGHRAYTDSMGSVRFQMPEDLPAGDYRTIASISKEGYISSELPITFMAGSLWHNRFSVSPHLQSEKYRIVVDWGKKPRDLDAHLLKKNAENQDVYHISFHDMHRHEDNAWLDIDDKNGEGPETITIKNLDTSANYRYFIHDYSNKKSERSTDLSKSRAHVTIYDARGLVRSFSVPYDEKGIIWEVFQIQQGQIIPVNKLRNTP